MRPIRKIGKVIGIMVVVALGSITVWLCGDTPLELADTRYIPYCGSYYLLAGCRPPGFDQDIISPHGGGPSRLAPRRWMAWAWWLEPRWICPWGKLP